jgi:hypothetical protein
MKYDCIAFVNAGGETLLTRTAFLTLERTKAEITALEASRGEKIYAIRSFADHTGTEVAVEILTPQALDTTEDLARVEYWRPHQRPSLPKFTEGQQLSHADYELAGVLITPANDAHVHAYSYTEVPFQRWNPDPRTGKSPAPSPGDIFVVTRPGLASPEAFAVVGVGYVPVNFSA